MKRRLILAIATTLVFGLSVATFAYKQTVGTFGTSVSCSCCKGDSCPMKKKDASGKETASCCDDCDCCKGDSCPMKMKGEKTEAASADMLNVTFVTSGKSCDGSCCKGEKTVTKTVAYYFKGQPHYKTSVSNCKCCSAKKDSQKS